MAKRSTKQNQDRDYLQVGLQIANMILVTVVAIFLAYKQNNFEKEQAEIARKSEYAQLNISPSCDLGRCLGTVAIQNTGPGTARNIRLVAVPDFINPIWQPAVTSIEMFRPRLFPISTEATVLYTSVSVLHDYQQLPGNNAIQVEIDSLPPETELLLVIDLEPVEANHHEANFSIAVYNEPAAGPMALLAPTQSGLYYETALVHFLEQELLVGIFVADVSCDNCVRGAQSTAFGVSSFAGWQLASEVMITSPEWQILHLNTAYYAPDAVEYAATDNFLVTELYMSPDTGRLSMRKVARDSPLDTSLIPWLSE